MARVDNGEGRHRRDGRYPGAVVGYSITVTNTGTSPYSGAAVSDALGAVLDDATYNSDVAATSGSATFCRVHRQLGRRSCRWGILDDHLLGHRAHCRWRQQTC